MNEAALVDIVHELGEGRVQEPGMAPARSRSAFSRRSISATSGRSTSAFASAADKAQPRRATYS